MEDEVARIEIDSFDKLSIVDFGIVGKTYVAIDIRNISNKEDRRRVMDFVWDYRLVEDVQLDRQIKKAYIC